MQAARARDGAGVSGLELVRQFDDDPIRALGTSQRPALRGLRDGQVFAFAAVLRRRRARPTSASRSSVVTRESATSAET